MPYLTLDPARILSTIALLRQRIEERFPTSGLAQVGAELEKLGAKAEATSEELSRPLIGLRIVGGLLGLLILAMLVVTLGGLGGSDEPMTAPEFIQLLESAINDVVFIGLGIFFLASLETRVKRKRALAAIHELRSIAHIVDMHQLTKDPAHALRDLADTPSSPARTLSQAELASYLDYCTEMLSLTGKIAALYAQKFSDGVVLSSVNEVEDLTTGLSRKIWQKLMILEQLGRDSRDA